jgi:hypothetical protein
MGRKKKVIQRKDLLSVRVKRDYQDIFFAETDSIDADEFLCIVIDIYEDEIEGDIYDVVPLEYALPEGDKLYITKEDFVIKKLS